MSVLCMSVLCMSVDVWMNVSELRVCMLNVAEAGFFAVAFFLNT